jgi:iron complex outermembrane receptor protein
MQACQLLILTSISLSTLAHEPPANIKELGVVTVTGSVPTSLPTQIPTTMEGITKHEIEETINATDSEDALKYFPSLLVRKRYIGDYNHAVLSSRASGTGNSARSAVYADGVLLSNYLGNGATFTPRWGLVTPEEIERVDVMYGPFSAAYPGNSVGAIVDYVTRMPAKFEAHAKAGYFMAPFKLYNSDMTAHGYQASASLGNRSGAWSWWINVNETDSHGQPLTFPTKLVSSGGAPAGTVVTGAVLEKDRSNNPWYILGTATEYQTLQDHAKFKLAYDISPVIRVSYTLGYWQNDAQGRPQSYLRDAAGNAIYSGTVNINGRSFTINPTDFNLSNENLTHVMHGFSIKSNTKEKWDWEIAASLYNYDIDEVRAPTIALPAALNGGAGTITDQHGTGWNTFALKGTWRPDGMEGKHIVDFGFQQEDYKLRILKSNITGDWRSDAAGSLNTDVGGKTQMQSLYAQDTWKLSQKWKAVLGMRLEQWRAFDGFTSTSTSALTYNQRKESVASPKAALAYQASPDLVLKGSVGRAVRMPTAQELYGATSGGALSFINDPDLKPEKSWTQELTAEKYFNDSLLRLTFFHEAVKDSLYSQLIPGSTTTSRVQNVDAIRTSGLEFAYQGNNIYIKGLNLSGSVTYADSKIVQDDAFPAAVGKWQPRVPRWRATALANYNINEKWNVAYGMRYSGIQYSTLDNSDPNGFAYQGASKFFTTDLRVKYQFKKQWNAAFGIDNVNNYKYWNFHPYPQRTYSAEIKFDL